MESEVPSAIARRIPLLTGLNFVDYTSDFGMKGAEFKTRRPHQKSRYGCTKCKDRRIKCDELMPRCSRCKKMDLSCQYRKKNDPAGPLWPVEAPGPDRGAGSTSIPETCGYSPAAIAGSRLSSPLALSPLDSPLQPLSVQTLAPIEFELFKHYLEHTSKDLTVDERDQYTLQIGIPSLACQSKPLMRSVLALAAVCKCGDMISQPPGSHKVRGQVVELLLLAHQYHRDSLREIQETLHEAKNYDHVLANAAMMGMYGSGSHCIRIWLAKTATPGDQAPFDLMPGHPQWMRLFRAVRLAYAGLLNGTPRTDGMASPIDSMACHGLQVQYEYKASTWVEQPRAPTDHPLGPILAATVGSALAKLHEKAADIAASNAIDASPELQACFTTLAIFSNIVAEAFPTDRSRQPGTAPDHHRGGYFTFTIDISPVGRLSEVSPWLRKYTASISSMIPSPLPRRTIMSLVHKAPTRYLNLTEEMIGLISQTDTAEASSPAGGGDGLESAWGSGPSTPPEELPSMAHQLAVEIFAHWLVLVMLLDNVWWIGGIGAWELGRIVSVRREARWSACIWNRDRDWWPESMFEVSRLFDTHR